MVGRAASCDFHLDEESVSRQHAELRADRDGVAVRDLGSANGTRVNGSRTSQVRLAANDVVTFGSVAFRLARQGGPDPSHSPPHAATTGPIPAVADTPPGTIVRAVDVHSGGGALARLHAERLARLVDLARQLSGEIEVERVLATVVDQAAALLPADRVALLLAEQPGGELRLAHWRNRLGTAPVEVPRSIARQAVNERSPVVTENAAADERFQSGSVVTTQVRAALCVPLLADQERVLGVLYVDSLTARQTFSENDAALCFAFGGLAAVCIAKAHYAEAARREEVIRANFERFFAPGVAARIAGQKSGVRPGGRRCPVTVLFSDVRGFTRLAESMPPEEIAQHLSAYFAAMVDLVFEYGGTLDKFIGDAILAVWGAPLSTEADTDKAVAAARAMQAEIDVLNTRWTGEGKPTLGVGIGLHYGEAFAGTIGSRRRLEYTVIGDVVNVAARLCKAAEAGEILLTDAVRSRLTALPAMEAREPLRLKNREEPVMVYRMEVGREG